jgi:hypothetical protein
MRVTGEVVRLNVKRSATRITNTLPIPQGPFSGNVGWVDL